MFISLCKLYHFVSSSFFFKKKHCFFFCSLNDFKEFADAVEAVKDKGVVVAVASPDDVAAANKAYPEFFQVNKAL